MVLKQIVFQMHLIMLTLLLFSIALLFLFKQFVEPLATVIV